MPAGGRRLGLAIARERLPGDESFKNFICHRGNNVAWTPGKRQGAVVVSFARQGRSHVQSFPRRRESTAQAIGNTLPKEWIPAFAGMTSVSTGIPFQMTPLPSMSEIAEQHRLFEEHL